VNFAQQSSKRMNATASKVSAAAAAIDSGKIKTQADLDKVIDKAARATGDAKQELHSSIVQLDKLAASVEKGGMKEEQSMDRAFAKANHALALEHRSKAAESWARKEYDKAGYELKASAHGLESAAGWIGGEAGTGVSATVADTRALGDKLAGGATWTRDEIARGFESLGNGINTLGHKISGTKVAATFHFDGARCQHCARTEFHKCRKELNHEDWKPSDRSVDRCQFACNAASRSQCAGPHRCRDHQRDDLSKRRYRQGGRSRHAPHGRRLPAAHDIFRAQGR
jgi:hypothetical protein